MANFLSLPRELREAIYQHLWSDSIRIKSETSNANQPSITSFRCSSSPSIGLVLTNRMIYFEAFPILYSTLNFVLDLNHAGEVMQFLRSLPKAARNLISHITLPNSRAWSPQQDAMYSNGLGIMGAYTPFRTFLSQNLPRLKEICLYMSLAHDGASYQDNKYYRSALSEITLLLTGGKLPCLNFVFQGDANADPIVKDEESMKGLLKLTRFPDIMLESEYESKEGDAWSRKMTWDERVEWKRKCDEFVRGRQDHLIWTWGDQRMHEGEEGVVVQAVLSCKLGKPLWS